MCTNNPSLPWVRNKSQPPSGSYFIYPKSIVMKIAFFMTFIKNVCQYDMNKNSTRPLRVWEKIQLPFLGPK